MAAEATDEYRSAFVKAPDGLRLHVRDYGARESGALPVVCLPGLARTSADFHELALRLAQDQRRPRRVIALDYRGRGRSDYDPDFRNYDILVELADLQAVLAAMEVAEAAFVGTSRGGILTMALSALWPAAIRGAVLVDIGPVIEGKGLARIKSYVGKMPPPRSWADAVTILKRMGESQFPAFGEAEWDMVARRTWKEENGAIVPDYDARLASKLEEIDLEQPLPELWPQFLGLAHAPVLVVRGENSDILSPATLEAMRARHPACEAITVPGVGHVPLVGEPSLARRIGDFIAQAERTPRRAPPAPSA
jgi:pimeloyl-ACP methyl ester carboxylesterase